jgi:predicted lipoprotein
MNYRKVLTISLTILIGLSALYNAIYFEKLDARKQKELVKKFKPKELVDYFWKNQLSKVLNNAISIELFDSLVKVNPTALAKQYGKTVGISSNYCVLVKGEVNVKMDESGDLIVIDKGNSDYKIVAKFVFSNTARDATGYFNVDDFQNSMDFNAISTEINARIVKDVLSKLASLPANFKVRFAGAIEYSIESVSKSLEIVPLKLEVLKSE